MLEGLLLALIAIIALVLAVKVVYAIVLVAMMLVTSIVRGILYPIFAGVWNLIVRPSAWLAGEILVLPFRVMGVMLRPVAPAGVASGLILGPICRNHGCRCANVAGARFCRRCGSALG